MADLSVVFMIGLLGSAHCIGMCGGFPLAIAQARAQGRSPLGYQLTYLLGKTMTYTLLGALAGAGGTVLLMAIQQARSLLSIVLGLFLVGIGLGLVGWLPRVPAWSPWVRWQQRLSRTLSFFLRKPHYGGTLGLGLVNGLLPCGLLYGILTKAAATGSIGQGALTLAVFGLATIPALLLLGMTGSLMRPLWRTWLNTVSGILVIVLGILTIVRGTPLWGMLMGGHTMHP